MQALGERVMPAYELIKEEARAAKAAGARGSSAAAPAELNSPSVPHFLPFTRWCAIALFASAPRRQDNDALAGVTAPG